MRKLLRVFFPLCLFSLHLVSQPSSTAQQITTGIKLATDKICAGSTAHIALVLNINRGWHVNSHQPASDYLIGTSFQLHQQEDVILADVQYPKGKLVSLSFSDQPIDVYEGKVVIFASIKISDKIESGIDTLIGTLTVQACNNQLCLAPSKIDVNIPLHIVGIADPVAQQNQDIFAAYHPTEITSSPVKNELATMFEEKGWFLAFLTIFLIGLALNLTPCVYPMLSVTVSLFGTQSETDLLRIFLKAVIYVLGIATMYSVLGVLAALGGGLFGSWLQSPWVLGGIAALLFALALSSFGLYQIQVPYWLTSKLGGQPAQD